MNRARITMPPFKAAAAMLRETTERLAREIVEPSDTAPEWNETEWVIARAAASMQGISALLANRLRWSGPEHWRSFLCEQRRQSALRHAHADSVLEKLDGALRDAGCQAVALKGSAIRHLDLYLPGERPMGDIDLLVSETDVRKLRHVVRDQGYDLTLEMCRHDVFEPRRRPGTCRPGEHIENSLKVEVHTRIAEALPVRLVDITDSLAPDSIGSGLATYKSIASLFLHITLHTAGNMQRHVARQIQFHDIARIAPLLGRSDWDEYLTRATTGNSRWWTYPPLAMTDRYYRGAVPAQVIARARAACPHWLRRWAERRTLTDVSWSNLRIHAFPGLAWSRSVLDVMRFMRRRIVPSRRALTELEAIVKNDVALQRIPWYGVSHWERMLRWVVSHPPRVQAMNSILVQFDSLDQQPWPSLTGRCDERCRNN